MSTLFLKLLNMSIAAGYLILVILVLRLILKKAPRWVFCLLWALAGIRLILPVSLETSFSLLPAKETIPSNIALLKEPVIHSGIEILDEAVNPVIATTFATDPISSANPLQIWIPIASYIWLLGVLGMLLYALISYLKLRKTVAASMMVEEKVMVCDDIKSPFILGIFRPRIYLPSSLDEKTKTYVLDHERAHLLRRDHWWKPLGFLLLSIYWFHPLCWVAYFLLCRDIELACDEKVVKEMDYGQMADYSQALLDCSMARKWVSACPLAFGEVGVKDRVKGVLHYKKPAFWILLVSLMICLLTAAFLLTDPFSSKSLSGKLAASVETAIKNFHRSHHSHSPGASFQAADIDVLRIEKSKGKITVYGNVAYEEYSFDGQEVKLESGAHTPTVITFATDEEQGDTYPVLEYWIPRDGAYYAGDIREKFPVSLWQKALNFYKKSSQQHENCLKMAEDYFHGEPYSNSGIPIEPMIMQATITEIYNGSCVVRPVEGSRELSSSDSFSIPLQNMEPSPEPVVGDLLEITYNGEILETYPAMLGQVYSVRILIHQDSEASSMEGEQESASQVPQEGTSLEEITELPGHVVFGSFSYEELLKELDLSSPQVITEGFHNTTAQENWFPTDRAQEELTVSYALAQTFYDEEANIWMVHFFNSPDEMKGESVLLDGSGVTLLIIKDE